MTNALIQNEVAIIDDPKATLPVKVAAAARLWALIDDAAAALENFKDHVRVLALKEHKDTVIFDGEGLTQCKVVCPRSTLKLKDGLDVDTERKALGDLFDVLFEVKLNLRDTDPDFVSNFPVPVQRHIASVTDLVTNKPRVSLKSLPGVSEMGSR
jgi:hypothetical protein